MSRDQRIARLLRAVTELSQEEFSRKAGLPTSLVAQVEACRVEPRRTDLQRMAHQGAGMTLSDADEILRHAEAIRDYRLKQEAGTHEVISALTDRLKGELSAVYVRLLALPKPECAPEQKNQLEVTELLRRLKCTSREARIYLVRVAEEFQDWALCEQVCEESIKEAARNIDEAADWSHLAAEIAECVSSPEGFRKRLLGYAGFHKSNVLRVAGELEAAEASSVEAEGLWLAGSDPEGLLDPGKRFDLKASLRRDQRRFQEALDLLEEAVKVSRSRCRILINKGFTLEVMGQYERAVEALLLASALLDDEGEPRLSDILSLNLANNFCHLGEHRNAAELVKKIRPRVADRGDEIDLIRIVWLDGRVEAGLGRPEEALKLLAEARRRFVEKEMFCDAALALLEEAVLLLDQGRSAEVKALAQELTVVFERQGVHREALAALRLFHEAAQREGATAELARDVLRYLFRARHDQGLRFGG